MFTKSRDPRPLNTVEDVAEFCQVSTKTVRRWIQRGELQAVRLGALVRVPHEELDAFINKGRRSFKEV